LKHFGKIKFKENSNLEIIVLRIAEACLFFQQLLKNNKITTRAGYYYVILDEHMMEKEFLIIMQKFKFPVCIIN
jgi:hypothetical protein